MAWRGGLQPLNNLPMYQYNKLPWIMGQHQSNPVIGPPPHNPVIGSPPHNSIIGTPPHYRVIGLPPHNRVIVPPQDMGTTQNNFGTLT